MTTKPTRTTRTTRATVPDTVPDTVSTTDVVATIIDVPAAVPDVPMFDPIASAVALTTAVGVTEPYTVPTIVVHMAHAFRAVHTMPVATSTERLAVRDAIVASFDAAMPNTPNTGVRNTGRFSGHHVFESQNTAYFAAAVSGVFVSDGHFVAMWAADLPNARCPYIDRVSYPTSTLSEYINGNHNAVPGVPGAVDVVRAWRVRGRKPVTA
jgi:hypothetical protein